MGGYPADVKHRFPPAGWVFRLELLRAAPHFVVEFSAESRQKGISVEKQVRLNVMSPL